MRVAAAFDHRGVKLRDRVMEALVTLGHQPVDLGADAPEPRIDYPDKARDIGECVLPGDAHQGVEHDDMNVLCLGSEVVGAELAADLVRAFLGARFDGGERYMRRLEKIEDMEGRLTHG